MSNSWEAIQKLITLVRLVQRSLESLGDVAELIEEAQSEGRELTDDEIGTVRARTDAAIAELRELE